MVRGITISAKSGIKTFRGPDDQWENHRVIDAETIETW